MKFNNTYRQKSPAGFDVLVIGGGNAALCGAITAKSKGASVLLLECAPKEFRGGNSRHTRNLRFMHASANEYLAGPYLEEEFWDDLLRVTEGNTNEELARFTIRESNNVDSWMISHGAMFQPAMRGTIEIGAVIEETDGTYHFREAVLGRTARRLMEGSVLVPEKYFKDD